MVDSLKKIDVIFPEFLHILLTKAGLPRERCIPLPENRPKHLQRFSIFILATGKPVETLGTPCKSKSKIEAREGLCRRAQV